MLDIRPTLFIVHEDPQLRSSLKEVSAAAGMRTEGFTSAAAFLDRPRLASACCLILGVRLPDLNGLQLQARLAERSELPVIFVASTGDVRTSVQAMKGGALEFLTKP